ncbi:hypothetical protein Aperf_G00000088176 [Anoplocephala perfoliata]
MPSETDTETEIPADTVYILTKPNHKVSHNTRVEWFIGNVNRTIILRSPGAAAEFLDWPIHLSPADWSGLSIVGLSPSFSKTSTFPLTYRIQPTTTVKYLAHSYRITFVLDLSDSMLQPTPSGLSSLHHAVVAIETILYNLIPPSSSLPLPLPAAYLSPFSVFISIIGVVPNRLSYTFIHDWEGSYNDIKSVINTVAERLFQLETENFLTSPEFSPHASALVDMLRHGVLTLAMQMPEWAPASIIIVSDACFTTLNMAELDRSLAHLRAASIRCSFIIPSACSAVSALDFSPSGKLRNLLSAISSSPCIPHVDLCQFIAHATAGFCLTGLSPIWDTLKDRNSSQWNQIHELVLALRLQDDITSTPEKEGELGWMPILEIQPYSRVVNAALTHVLASRLKDGYRLRAVSKPSPNEVGQDPSTSSWIQIELALAWKPGVIFRLFLAGEWFLPTGQLPVCSSSDYLLPVTKNKNVVHGRYCVANLRVRANSSLLRIFREHRLDQITSSYLASTLERFDFHFRLLKHVDDYLEIVSSFNINADIYTVPIRYMNGLCSVFITAQGAGGGSEIYLSGNTAKEMEHDKSLATFVHYWGRLISLDIANCYRWMHSETIYVVLEHDSPIPSNLFIPTQTRRVTDSLTCRQSLARIHSMLSEWCTFVLLENHTYIRLEYPNRESLEDPIGSDAVEITFNHSASLCVPCYFTLVRLEMKLPEIRVRVAFTAGVQNDYRRATIDQLSQQFKRLSFLPRGRQAVPKSRHKSGTPAPLYPPTEAAHVPPLQRSWGETPCCLVFHSQLDRLVVETGTWSTTRQQNYRNPSLPSASNSQTAKSFLKGTITEARCEVAPSLLRQHLYNSACIWVIPVVSKSPNCIGKMFSTLTNLRIQEGFHFIRGGPQPGFVSLAREVMFSVNSAAEGAVKQPCLIQYQLYPFQMKSSKTYPANEEDKNFETASYAVQKVLDAELDDCTPRTLVNRLRALSSAQITSEIHIATEVWIEPKHGHATDLPTEALYMAGLSYSEVVQRIMQLDCFCLAAYTTLEKMLTACLLKIIELKRLATASPAIELRKPVVQFSAPSTNSTSLPGLAAGVPFNLATVTSISPRMCLLYPVLLDAFLVPNTTSAVSYLSSENVISRLVFNLNQRTPYITFIPLSNEDSKQFSQSLISEEPEEVRPRLEHALVKSGSVQWQCFATLTSLIETISRTAGGKSGSRSENRILNPFSLESLVETSSVEIAASPVTFFVLPADMKSATSVFCQDLMNSLRQRLNGSSHSEASFPIFIYSCTHTYLSFPLDDRWTYSSPGTLVIDFFRQEQETQSNREQNSRFIHREELTSSPPLSFLAAAKGNFRLTTELTLLWTRLRDASLGLLNLCNEAFVECAHRTLLHGFMVSGPALRSVLTSEQFCSPLTPICIDATDFLFSTCSHCFNAMRNRKSSSTTAVVKKRSISECEIRPHDVERIRNRISSVFKQYFSPIPQFQGFYYFRGEEKGAFRNHGQKSTAQRCDTWPVPFAKSSPSTLELPVQTPTSEHQQFAESQQVVLCTSESDTDDVKKRFDAPDCKETISVEPDQAERRQLLYKKPLFLKVLMKLRYATEEEVILPVESLPICLPNVMPNCGEINRQNVHLSIVFIPLLWKPEVGVSLPETPSAESSDHQEMPPSHLDRLEEGNESSNNSTGSESEDISEFNKALDETLNPGSLNRPPPSSQMQSLRGSTFDSPNNYEEDDVIVPSHWCECQLEVSENDNPCCICRTTYTSEFIHYLDSEQWLSVQQTAQMLRWLLQDEVVCSQRLLQPLLVSTVESVLRHMETTKSLLLSNEPGTSSHSPFHTSHSHARLSKSCTTSGEEGAHLRVSDVLLGLMSAIGWETVDLKFIFQSEKSIPRFVHCLQSVSFRYAQARLIDMGDYYVVCKAEPIPLTPNRGLEFQEVLDHKEASASPIGITRHSSVLSTSSEVTAYSLPLNISLQPVPVEPAAENISDESAEFESISSKTRPSSVTSLEQQQNLTVSTPTTTEGELDESQFPLASHFPLQDTVETTSRKRLTEGPALPAYWLIFRVGDGSIQAFFHHSDTHRETSSVEDSCPHCIVFRRAIGDIEAVVRLVNQSLLLDQLVLDRLCHSALLPEPEEPPRHLPPRHLHSTVSSRRRPVYHLMRSPSLAVSTSSATDSDNTDGHSLGDNTSRKKSSISGYPTEAYPPGSLACPSKFSFNMEVSPRAVIAGERGNQVLPELRRHLENFVVLNRKNMFVFNDVDPVSDVEKSQMKKSLIPRIFYMLLNEVPAFETSGRRSHPDRRESLPFPLTSNISRIQLQVTLHGILSPSRTFCTFVKSLLQSLLDKIVLENLHQALSRTVLFRFTPHDFEFLFMRRTHVSRHELFFLLPRFLLDSSAIPRIPKGSLIFPFCQYLKQNLLTCMTAAKPEKEVLSSLRSHFGCGEVMLYHRRRSAGTAKFGLVTALVDLLQADTHEPFCISSCLDLQEWTHRRRIREDLSAILSTAELTEILKDLHMSQDTFPSSSNRLVVRLRLWVREDVDLKLLNRKLFSAIQNAVFDLLMEYLILSLPVCAIEAPILRSCSSEPSPNSTAQPGDQLFNNDFFRLPNFVSQYLLPWFEVATSSKLPLVIERRLQLASLQSVELLVEELVSQLNSFVESRIGLPVDHYRCPIHSSSGSSSSKSSDGRERATNFQPQQPSGSITCTCQQCINFSAFEAVLEGHQDWKKFSKARPFCQNRVSFSGQQEFLIVGKNYASSQYHPNRHNSSSSSAVDEDRQVLVKHVASRFIRSPLQRHQSLEVQVQQIPDEANPESSTASEDAANDSTNLNPTVPSNATLDIPEFCEMQLRIPKFLFRPRNSSNATPFDEPLDGPIPLQSPVTTCLQVPRETFCVVHLRGREVRINLYNWSRDDADRLLLRIESLVIWYNQRFQLLGCMSLQKMGLFHCLRTPSHLQLLKKAIHLSTNISPPEPTPSASTSVPGQATVTASTSTSMNIRRRFLEELVGSGAPIQQPPPIDIPNPSSMAPQNSAASPVVMMSPTTPAGEGPVLPGLYGISNLQQPHLRVVSGNSKEYRDFNLTRIYQNCAQVPILEKSSSPVEHMDVVHLHVDQALRAVKNDRARAEKLRLITAPLKVWMTGDVFDVDRYNSSTPSVESSKASMAPPATVFYSAVKRFCRTLHTVCSPILFSPSARLDALKLRELEQIAEDERYRRFARHEGPKQSDIAEEGPKSSNTPGQDSSKRTKEPLTRRRDISVSLSSRATSSTHVAASRETPPWMQEAMDCLLQEFIAYMTRQMHFTVIYSTLNGDANRLKQPYALLQRSVKMSGIHLIEIFIRNCLFCVRLKAVELCRLTRAASRALLTGPLAADVFARAAAVAAVKITSGMIDPSPMTSSSITNTAISSASTSVSGSPYVVKWEESSRLCDCVHLHSFLYDFYLRHVDSFLKLQSDLIGQRMQVPSLAWALPQAMKTSRRPTFSFGGSVVASGTGGGYGGTGGSYSVARHPFLPANYPVVTFLRDLAQIVPQAPVFARGIFAFIPMCLTSDTRIKPEQIFEHLIESRQVYGFRAFDLGINSSLPIHARFGLCSFTSPAPPSVYVEEGIQPTRQSTRRQSSCEVEDEHETSSGTFSAMSAGSETGTGDTTTKTDEGNTEEVTSPFTQHKHSTMSRFGDQLRLPSLKHFSLACAAFLDSDASTKTALTSGGGGGEGGASASRRIFISVFVILTDQNRRFPRPRLSSLPQGISPEVRIPFCVSVSRGN